jgi:integrase
MFEKEKSVYVWLIFEGYLEIDIECLNVLFCVDIETGKIGVWLTSFKKITIQNTVTKLKKIFFSEAEKSLEYSHSFQCVDRNFLKSKAFRNFLNEFSTLKVPATINFSDIEINSIKEEFLKNFQNYKLNDKTVEQEITARTKHCTTFKSKSGLSIKILSEYIKIWNKSKNSLETKSLSSALESLEQKSAEIVEQTPFDATVKERLDIKKVQAKFEDLKTLIERTDLIQREGMIYMAQNLGKEFVAIRQEQKKIVENVKEIKNDVKKLIPKDKKRHTPRPLRDPISRGIFEIFLFNAGSNSMYQKEIKTSQLKIAYTLLYHLGLRLNELRFVSLDNIFQSMKGSQFRITLYKTNKSHNYTFSSGAQKDLERVKKELHFLSKTHGFKFIFGKKSPMHSKALLRLVNLDLGHTCKTCEINSNITSHSFRISVISRLLLVTDVQTVADIIGHDDVRSTLKYSRYKLTDSKIQNLCDEAENLKDLQKK